jgi:restriction system protein
MKKARLLESTRRGCFCITKQGKEVLAQNPQKINVKFLRQFPDFVEFQKPKKKGGIDPPPTLILKQLQKRL